MRNIKFYLEYMAPPFFCGDDEFMGHIEIDELPISVELKNDLTKWDRIFQASLDENHPPDSGFSSEEADDLLFAAIAKEGVCLLKRLRQELGDKYIITSDYDESFSNL